MPQPRRSLTPYLTTARFDSICPETGKAIKKGEQIAYFPQLKRAYHQSSKAAEELRAIRFANSWGMADANW